MGIDGGPRSAVVIGAGVVGLSTAWFLQERGVDVTVVDRDGVAAGASWGNAGWLSPGLAIPLNEPGVLRYGLRSLLDRNAPLHVPATPDPGLWSFLARFAANCTWKSWGRAVQANLPFNEECLEAFDVLTAGGVEAPTVEAPIMAAFENPRQAVGLLHELQRINRSGLRIDYSAFEGEDLHKQAPQLSLSAKAGIRLDGQRYVDPGRFTRSLADAVTARGGTIRSGFLVTGVDNGSGGLVVRSGDGDSVRADVVVLATGAWLNGLGREWGVRVPVRAGRGYSFTVPTEEPVSGPIYLPAVRVACTPYQGKLRVAGTMEFRDADAPLHSGRVDAIIRSARKLLTGVSWAERTDTWVGPRPVTPDGRPLIGATNAPGRFVAGGHGMWGLTHGPVTGRMLAEQITTGRQPAALRDFDPVR
ncbi:NAD(P)/FAD-dependent oxidoreductase [Streptosporangium sp. NBC_01756]|uniref:NAD(P)/FAD-dependent oxidoreductase n=1 Tax=Streptosporangium sp. NBC_01756 TaxID=2975950 RepID=UPI002DDA278C|nr:FAD-dependent oxidoreductase [Streptosporangium sp. NBC_01756]WSC84668.1 FAD-dependent oxidoreductase [Streptosporangium sp. NBC_01756]